MVYKNAEGYADPTAGTAIANICTEERKQEQYERLDALDRCIKIMKQTAELAGFEVSHRNVLRDKKTGREYR
jgi:hypothetical protein